MGEDTGFHSDPSVDSTQVAVKLMRKQRSRHTRRLLLTSAAVLAGAVGYMLFAPSEDQQAAILRTAGIQSDHKAAAVPDDVQTGVVDVRMSAKAPLFLNDELLGKEVQTQKLELKPGYYELRAEFLVAVQGTSSRRNVVQQLTLRRGDAFTLDLDALDGAKLKRVR